MRDPHIIRSPQGNHFYLIATDLSHTTTLNWGNESKSGSKSIAIYDSDDLVNWSDERLVKVAVDTAGCAWAPESVYDEETGKYMVFWSSLVSEDNYKKHRVYRSYTTDFVTFENPEIWIDNDYSTIDVSVKKIGDRYYRMSKNEESGAKYVYWEYSQTAEEAAADNTVPLLGTWMPIPNDNIKTITSAEGTSWEGALFYKVNGDNNAWRTMIDHFQGFDEYPNYGLTQFEAAGGISTASAAFADSTIKLPPYSDRIGTINGTGSIPYKHGCVIPITDTEYNALVEKYGISTAPPSVNQAVGTSAKIRVAPVDGKWSTSTNSGGTAIVSTSSEDTTTYELNSGNMMGAYYRFDFNQSDKKIVNVTLNMPNATVPNDNVSTSHRVRIAAVTANAAKTENNIANIFKDISDSGFFGKTAEEITNDTEDIKYVLAQPVADSISSTDITDIYDTTSETNCFYIYNALGTNTGTKYSAPAYAYLTVSYIDKPGATTETSNVVKTAKIRVSPVEDKWSTSTVSSGTAIVASAPTDTATYELNSGNMMGVYYRFETDTETFAGQKISKVMLNMPNANVPNDNDSCKRVRIAPVKYDAAKTEDNVGSIFTDISDSGFFGKTAQQITDNTTDIKYITVSKVTENISSTDITEIYDTTSKTNCFYIYNALGTNTGTKYYAPGYAYLTVTYEYAEEETEPSPCPSASPSASPSTSPSASPSPSSSPSTSPSASPSASPSVSPSTGPTPETQKEIHFAKVEKTENGISYKVESTLDDTTDIYVALYSKESGVLLSVSKSEEDVFTGISDNQAYRIKAFAWKPGTLEPMCRCIYADITEETTV